MQNVCRSNDLQFVGVGVSIGWILKTVCQAFSGDPNYKQIEDLSQNVETLILLGVGLKLSVLIIISIESVKWYRHINAEPKKVEIKDLNTVLTQLMEVLKNFETVHEKLKPTKDIAYIEDLNSETENEGW